MQALNPYTITWTKLVPIYGKATKKDKQLIALLSTDESMSFVSPNKNKAIEKTKALKGKLSKPYIAFSYTDKQFGQAIVRDKGLPVTVLGHRVKLTTMQRNNSIVIH